MDIGVFLPTMTRRGAIPDRVLASAQHAERLGYTSVWAVDQLIAGTGVPFIDSTVALAAVAGGTSTIQLGYGVLIAPLRPVVWAARQAASLQLISNGRLLLGIGAGGDRHALSWQAIGVPRRERGKRTDKVVALLPDLIAGKSADIDGFDVQLAPGVSVPPLLIGGASDAALSRTVRNNAGWFAPALVGNALHATVDRLLAIAKATGQPMPLITGSVMVALDDDPTVPDDAAIREMLTDPAGVFGMSADTVLGLVQRTTQDLQDAIAQWQAVGAERIVISIAAGDWERQAALAYEAFLSPS